jgi:hypothetical protein
MSPLYTSINMLFRTTTLLCLLLISSVGVAENLEMLLMPGPVIEGHKKYEEQCDRCHKPFSKRSQSNLCNDCHETIKADIEQTNGFHGKRLQANKFRCRDCHTEHLGRGADIVKLNSANFDHDKTNYPLKGEHKKARCNSCHEAEQKKRKTSSNCFDCHQKNDPHREALGKKCDECHSEKSWSEYRFDHDKTDFKLKHKHQKVACDSCHPDSRYKPTPKRCIECHRYDDSHAGSNGEKCQACHDERDWKKNRFSHKKDADYALQGAHKNLPCSACHKDEVIKKKSKKERRTQCINCHKEDDQHLGRYGDKCKTCHSQKAWSTTLFDHEKDAKYPLVGRHKKARCDSCHPGVLYQEKLENSCNNCHLADDPHDTPTNQSCSYCHNEEGWNKAISFDHGFTTFPLVGLHGMVSCENCHLSRQFLKVKSGCIDCHKQNDEHKKRLGEQCATCHNPNSWKLWQFNHDKQTDYTLTGKHEGLACKHCHTEAEQTDRKQPRVCRDCHLKQDSHQQKFGSKCGHCHSTENWLDVTLPKDN